MNTPENTSEIRAIETDETAKPDSTIRIRGARQHNLKNLDIDIQTGELTVFTGPSGSGKSSLVFDTLYAEGQRRYVETFSAYARQFLDRMDKPAVDKIEGVPPAIAIDQTNPVRNSRSTVGTMTELNDHLKLLFARTAHLYDRVTAEPVQHDTPESVYRRLTAQYGEGKPGGDARLIITFAVELPANTTEEQMQQWLSASGFTKVQAERMVDVVVDAASVDPKKSSKTKAPKTKKPAAPEQRKVLDVVADRFRASRVEQGRFVEALEVAFKRGNGRLAVYVQPDDSEDVTRLRQAQPERSVSPAEGSELTLSFSQGLHSPASNIRYQEPTPSMFSFNSPAGACEACRGFGRVIGVDWGLVIPDEKLTLRKGAIKAIQTPAWKEIQDDLMRHAGEEGIPRDTAWNQLTQEQKDWVIHGSPKWNGKWNQTWYGIARFFEYLESKAYKMHIRVLLSKYRSYTTCPTCAGARLKTESLLWRIGTRAAADAAMPSAKRFKPTGVQWSDAQLAALPGLCLHDLMQLPLRDLYAFTQSLQPEADEHDAEAQATRMLLEEINTRLKFLNEVGIGYLTLDRQSRTLSGGEVQRINLTTALGTSLVNTLFVLDEPSIGLHPRDMQRINQAMLRLRDAGNTLVVVEHDPAVMLAADRIIDMGPKPGSGGGQIVFDGTPEALRSAHTLTGDYLGARLRIENPAQRPVLANTPRLLLQGARANNLQNVDVEFPLERMVCVTGVSGSGKSTLIQDVLAPALMRAFGKATDAPGAHDALLGTDFLADAVFVDQSPIGKTARSNPASYVGAWDAIRTLFAQTPMANQRGYTASKFSFNSGDGRCPVCGGSGFEHVEMQFLSDVYLRCPECDGSRYRPEILEVKIERPAATASFVGETSHPTVRPELVEVHEHDADASVNRLRQAQPERSKTSSLAKNHAYSVADILELTVEQALQVFAQDRDVVRALQPIADVGLEYLRLGQPVPTLSGGEAQRLKLAGFLAEAAQSASKSRQTLARKGTLFLFDEPTTGLHFDDIAKLMRALRKLLAAGHSLIIIEHNLDVMRSSDWLIDLGPDAGDQGGHIVVQGTPQEVAKHPTSFTAAALREYEATMGQPIAAAKQEHAVHEAAVAYAAADRKANASSQIEAIQIVHAREHNLKNLSVNIPRGKFNVITGVSGSGKSTLAFDILFSEGQRRYLESLNAYARSIVQPASRPDVDAVHGIPPTVAIEQRLSRGGRKSTVGTATEIWHYLRLLYVKLGTQHCVNDDAAVQPQSQDSIVAHILRQFRGQHIGLLAPLVVNRKGIYTDLADWARLRGHTHLRVDGAFVPTAPFPKLDRFKEHSIELPVFSLDITPENEAELRTQIAKALEHGKGVMQVISQLDGLSAALENGSSTLGIGEVTAYSTLRACPVCCTSYPELDPRLFSYNSKHGWCPDCVGTGVALTKEQRKALDDSGPQDDNRGRERSFEEPDAEDMGDAACPTCHGTRLNATARKVRFHGQAITDIAQLSVSDIRQWVEALTSSGQMNSREADIARDLLPEIRSRLAFLEQVGLGYLTLDRGAPTLSGGEAQRIRLAAQLGSNLQGVCYVLDEPTIGLHARDNQILLGALQSLSDKGNTLVVVEHDEDTIRHADYLIDVGPGAGVRGGTIVAEGKPEEVAQNPDSITGKYLRDAMRHPFSPRREVQLGMPALTLQGATLHNLQNVGSWVPLQRLVAITGVSGSGKSTLARDVLLANVARVVSQQSTKAGREALEQTGPTPHLQHLKGLQGFEGIDRVLEVDQTPIGKTPRSCPATYIGFWDTVRKLFADTLEAKARGYSASRFSFNTGEGRCPACEGQGMRTIEMSFLPDVKVPCETCHGARFNPETLSVTWRGKTIGDVLQMEVDDAVTFFASMPTIAHPLQLLKDVGLGYLTLGQPSPTLSGGEAQRIKLVTELTKVRDDITKRGNKMLHTLYVLDEPTVGLHMADVEKLIHVLHRLVNGGHSVIVIEHDLDVIAEADWIIDLGPDGGKNGGQIVAAGTPEDVVKEGTFTGVAIAPLLNLHKNENLLQ
ncbi:excinuclease ABC subunit A [Lampropedia puyangensis]|uniref:UvrABC system protein A n=1 Tax=Lampropedia puyangensis TaxID=1330072 RepID=A0A4V4GR20_9BURK|nr:excinuclease ABC subunit UvrA [Lampropedia puyangensis]THT99635.1 excinuclease ABC subunit A [Lampropedia puyangensis]